MEYAGGLKRCPICGSEIEIADVLDFDNPRKDQFEAVGYLMENKYHLYHGCVRFILKCGTCKKGLCLNINKNAFNNDMDKMIGCA